MYPTRCSPVKAPYNLFFDNTSGMESNISTNAQFSNIPTYQCKTDWSLLKEQLNIDTEFKPNPSPSDISLLFADTIIALNMIFLYTTLRVNSIWQRQINKREGWVFKILDWWKAKKFCVTKYLSKFAVQVVCKLIVINVSHFIYIYISLIFVQHSLVSFGKIVKDPRESRGGGVQP